jgi:predicted esterase
LAAIPETRTVSEGVWLSNDALVYVNNGSTLVLIQKTGDDWHKAGLLPATKPANAPNPTTNAVVAVATKPAPKKAPAASAPPKDPVQNLVAISKKSVAWRQGGSIWMFELGAAAPVKIWEQTNNVTLVNFCFADKLQAFRLHGKNAGGEFLFYLYPAFIWHEERITDAEPIKPVVDPRIIGLSFIQNGQGYAYLTRSLTFDATVIQTDSNSAPVQLTWAAGVDMDSLAANDNHVYATGSPTNGPLNIWDYDVKAGTLSYAGTVALTHESATNANGGTVIYHLSPPVNFVAGRKYPLVITFNGVRWRPQEGNLPNAGCFLASLNEIPSDQRDVIAVYEAAIRHPGVDPNRVYAMGVSAGAGMAAQLLADQQDLWRGAILLSPLYFPDVARLKAARILIDSATGDAYLKQAGGVGLLTKFQDAAALAGIPVTLSINDGAGHVYRSKVAEEQRVSQILEFVAEDK